MGAVWPGVASGEEKRPAESQLGKGAFYSSGGAQILAGKVRGLKRAGNARASQGQFWAPEKADGQSGSDGPDPPRRTD